MKVDSSSSQPLTQSYLAEEEAREIARKAEEHRNAVQRDADRSVQMTEEEAASRLKVAQLHAANTAREAEAELAKMRENYSRELANESGRNQRSLLTERNKGEADVRRQVNENNRDLHRVRRNYEDYRKQMDERYKTQIQFADTEQRRAINQEMSRQIVEKDAIKTQGDQNIALLKQSYDEETRRLAGDLNQKQVALNEYTRSETERLQENMMNSQRLLREQHEQRYADHLTTQREQISKVATEAEAEKAAIRRSNAMDVAKYSTRQADPFYRLRELQSTLKESDQGYELTASIPKHEQGNVSVIARDNTITITGYRESKETDQKDTGERSESHSYQTFRKTYDLAIPVEPRLMRKEFVGDELRIILPKKTGSSALDARPAFRSKYSGVQKT